MSPLPHRFAIIRDFTGTLARGAGAIAVLGLMPALQACSTLAPAEARAAAERYELAIVSPVRTDSDRHNDAERHPAQFLPFTQVRPGMQVLDVSAGGGYTSQLLALAVGPTGMVWAQAPRPGAALTKRLSDHPQANVLVVARPFDDPVPEQAPKLDLITLILNYHDISYLPVDRAQMNRKLFAALKPGGHYVVIDHSARGGTGISEGKTLHRIDEAVVLTEVRQAGFVLEAESDFLRNPADPRDRTSSGSPIPTDKFALRFVKPR
ncbi:MAG: class I SAM-dependent methyltransferase [Burkholderiales bacterium]|jgi:predicted methyltransferase